MTDDARRRAEELYEAWREPPLLHWNEIVNPTNVSPLGEINETQIFVRRWNRVVKKVNDVVAQAVHEYRTKARGSMAAGVECDLCEEIVTEWEWVDHGWSLACRPCLDKIRAQAVRETTAGVWEAVASLSASGTPPEGMAYMARKNAEALRREPQPAPGPPGDHALQFPSGREPVAFDYGKIGVTCGCGRTPVHSTVDPKFHPEEA